MFVTLKRLLEWIFLVFVFFAFTLFMYRIVFIVNTWIEPNQYKEPKGNSIKVNEMKDDDIHTFSNQQNESFVEQLKLFYWSKE